MPQGQRNAALAWLHGLVDSCRAHVRPPPLSPSSRHDIRQTAESLAEVRRIEAAARESGPLTKAAPRTEDASGAAASPVAGPTDTDGYAILSDTVALERQLRRLMLFRMLWTRSARVPPGTAMPAPLASEKVACDILCATAMLHGSAGGGPVSAELAREVRDAVSEVVPDGVRLQAHSVERFVDVARGASRVELTDADFPALAQVPTAVDGELTAVLPPWAARVAEPATERLAAAPAKASAPRPASVGRGAAAPPVPLPVMPAVLRTAPRVDWVGAAGGAAGPTPTPAAPHLAANTDVVDADDDDRRAREEARRDDPDQHRRGEFAAKWGDVPYDNATAGFNEFQARFFLRHFEVSRPLHRARLRLFLELMKTGADVGEFVSRLPPEERASATRCRIDFSRLPLDLPSVTTVHREAPSEWNVSKVLLALVPLKSPPNATMFATPSDRQAARFPTMFRVLATNLLGEPFYVSHAAATKDAAFRDFLHGAPASVTGESVSPVFIASPDLAGVHPRLLTVVKGCTEEQTGLINAIHRPAEQLAVRLCRGFASVCNPRDTFGPEELHREAVAAVAHIAGAVLLRFPPKTVPVAGKRAQPCRR